MNDRNAPHAKTKTAIKPVDRPSGLAPAAEAFEALKAEYAKLPDEALSPINVDIPRAVAVVLGAEPRVRTLLPEMEAALKSPPKRVVESLRQMALGAWYAHLVAMPAKSDRPAKDLLEQATALRAKLLKAADALADAELVDATAVARIREGSGNIDKANDLVALAALFSQSWDAIHNKTAIAREQVDEAALLGPRLLVALAEEPLPKSDHANDTRQRAFSLLVHAYDEVRRAVTHVRWAEGDADTFAPSLYTKSRKRKSGEAGEGDGDGSEDDGAANPVESRPT
ncbi:MAG: hypothetical protein BGO98_40025 [Myxococcales bacterium 68-20]|nr:MAG: hypothetical protein BGO98_40025 [Myxococcales bacterium 68-20]